MAATFLAWQNLEPIPSFLVLDAGAFIWDREMAHHYVLDWDAKVTIVGHVEDKNARSLGNKFTRGRPLAPDLSPVDLRVLVELGPEGDYPDYFTLQQTPIASGRFLNALGGFADAVEVYAAPIVESDRVVHGHFVLNVAGCVDCLDRERAQVALADEDTDAIVRMTKLAVSEERAGASDLARLHGFELVVLVSRRVRDALQGMDGVSLLPAEGWSDSVWF